MQGTYSNTHEQQPVPNEGRIATQYAYLVKRASAHLRSQVGGGLDLEDIEQAGMLGLVQAIRRYGDIDDDFEKFAFIRIRGAMLDEVRSMDWRSRTSRDETHRLTTARSKLYNLLQREPTDQELSKTTGFDLEKIRELQLSAQAGEINQLEDWMAEGFDDDRKREGLSDKKLILAEALEKMNERQRLIISLYYYYGMNMEEIALTLGVTNARVCQLHKDCLAFLNRLLKD